MNSTLHKVKFHCCVGRLVHMGLWMNFSLLSCRAISLWCSFANGFFIVTQFTPFSKSISAHQNLLPEAPKETEETDAKAVPSHRTSQFAESSHNQVLHRLQKEGTGHER